MTNNDELALKLNELARRAVPGPWGIARDRVTVVSNQSHPIAKVSDAEHRMLSDLSTGMDVEFIATANPANILSLLEERDWQTKRIEMLEKYANERDEENQGLLLTVGRLHTKLEAHTVSVKLPRYDIDTGDCDSCGQDCGADMSEEPDGDYVLLADVIAKLAAAGIKLEVEE